MRIRRVLGGLGVKWGRKKRAVGQAKSDALVRVSAPACRTFLNHLYVIYIVNSSYTELKSLGVNLDVKDYCRAIYLDEIEMIKVTCNIFQI